VSQLCRGLVLQFFEVRHFVCNCATMDKKNRPVDEQLLMDSYRGNLPAVIAAISQGADVGVRGIPNATLWLRDSGGFSPLFAASTDGSPECVSAIIAHGGDPNLKAGHGQTPLNMIR
jgi:ankyrin repeat protein